MPPLESSFGRSLSQQSYVVHMVHVPIIVPAVAALKDVALAPLLKFGLRAVIVVPSCFVISYIVRRYLVCLAFFGQDDIGVTAVEDGLGQAAKLIWD